MRAFVRFACAVVLLWTPAMAWADAATSDTGATPARHDVGDTDTALPGLAHVGIVGTAPPGVSFAGTVGYGLTEKALGTRDLSHRLLGKIAASVRPTDWLAVSLRFEGRYDSHGEGDDGFVGDPWLAVRFGSTWNALRLGGEVSVWVPGDEAPSLEFAATTVEAKGLFAYDTGPWTWALNAGFRLDQSEKSVDRNAPLTSGDVLSLGVSSWNAVLLGIGVAYRLNRDMEMLGEVSSQMLVGKGAPSPLESPLRLDAGLRYGLTDAMTLEARGEVTLSTRPDEGSVHGAVPIEPRFSVLLGLRYRLPFSATGRVEESALATHGVVRGIVLNGDGRPVSGATVSLHVGSIGATLRTDSQGRFRFANVSEGEGSLMATADGYGDKTQSISVVGGKTEDRELVLEEMTRGQLRGLIRDFDGKPLRATVRVMPGKIAIETDENGRFQLNVSPGAYQVSVSVPGYEGQKRNVQVDENGVTVFNAELHRGNRR